MKNAKKSMFITTILMVAVLIVAVSTATFAWYTAQTTVDASSMKVTSAQSSSAALAIDTALNTTSSKTNVVLTATDAAILPAVPTAQPTTDTTYSAFVSGFLSAPVNAATIFTANGAATTPATIKAVDSQDQNYFFVINTNSTASTGVKANVSIDTTGSTEITTKPADYGVAVNKYYSDAACTVAAAATWEDAIADEGKVYVKNSVIADDLRVAMFIGAGEGTAKLVQIWGNGKVAYGPITNNKPGQLDVAETELQQVTGIVSALGADFQIGTLNALQAHQIYLVAWFEGTTLVATDAGLPAAFNVNFTAGV